jgi:predicted transcriptional regulator YdeE
MQKSIITIPEKKLVGITTRTSNKDEFDPSKSKIGTMMQSYWQNAISDKILNRKNPGTTICAYMDYESDYTGRYTYFIGEEVSSFTSVTGNLVEIIILAQTYCKFTTTKGIMPKIIIDAWLKIWQMNDQDFGSKRAYLADYEVYDQRAIDPNNAVVDIYIGII